MHIRNALGNDGPRGLADQLPLEISRGHHPVWPSTERHAARLAEGLADARATRPDEVDRAVALAPEHGPLDWGTILLPARGAPRRD